MLSRSHHPYFIIYLWSHASYSREKTLRTRVAPNDNSTRECFLRGWYCTPHVHLHTCHTSTHVHAHTNRVSIKIEVYTCKQENFVASLAVNGVYYECMITLNCPGSNCVWSLIHKRKYHSKNGLVHVSRNRE